MAGSRRSKMLGRRRRVEDEAEDEGVHDHLEIDDDSLTEGSVGSDDRDHDAGSDTSNIDETSPVTPSASKSKPAANGAAKLARFDARVASDTQLMMHGIPTTDNLDQVSESHPEEGAASEPSVGPAPEHAPAPARGSVPNGPLVVSSKSAPKQPPEPASERRRREHEEYRRKRDEDPAFVPNRGAFFMHDHRHAGPAANGFRPFGRGRGRGRGGAIGGPYAPFNQFQGPSDPLTSNQWAHDMHDVVTNPMPPRHGRSVAQDEGPPNGNGVIPTCPPSSTPINRTMSTEKQLGNVQVKVCLPFGKGTTAFSMPFKQYTKLPDHRPPLRRDKPVRISLPDNPPRYIFPAIDRSFIFIPRAMRPNQQRARGKPRPGLGSVGGFSRRPSVLGGSFYGSTYSPSIALSRRSSLAHDGRDYAFSPTGSVISRPPVPTESNRPIVRLPPAPQQASQPPIRPQPQIQPQASGGPDVAAVSDEQPAQPAETSINDLPPPQTHPLPQKPNFPDNRQSLPMHQPRPQKAVSVADIESNQQPFQQAFHQQVPVQVSNGLAQESHSRQHSYQSQPSTATPLSHIPERAIHAAPFQPTAYPPQGFYGPQQYPVPQPQQQQGYYYPHQPYPGAGMPPPPPSAAPAPFVPPSQPGQTTVYTQPPPALDAQQAAPQTGQGQQAGQLSGPSNMVAQEVNGMVYYYDASQMPPPMGAYPGFQGPQPYGAGVPGMGGVVAPSPDGFFYPPGPPGVVYYPQ